MKWSGVDLIEQDSHKFCQVNVILFLNVISNYTLSHTYMYGYR